MSGTSSASVVTVAGVGGGVGEGAVGGGCYSLPPFTAVQWQELEHQAMIYKYIIAGLPVPPELVVPIRRSFEALSSRFFHHSALGYCSYYGKKFDPEPGRCRRTDGKKWRCAKDAYPDSKYCERHMHRGRNRSRKPVESHSASQSLSSAMSHMATGSSSSGGVFQSSSSGSFQSMPLYSVGNSDDLYSGCSVTKLQIDPVSYGGDNKDYRYIHGPTPDTDQRNFSPEASGSVANLGMGSSVGNSWHLLPSQVPSSPLLKSRNDPHLFAHSSSDVHMTHAFDPIINANLSKQRQQHCFFGSEIGSPGSVKQEQHSMRPFFDEWPTTKESWSNLDDGGSNKNAFSTTRLSICIPMTRSEFSSRDSRSSDDA